MNPGAASADARITVRIPGAVERLWYEVYSREVQAGRVGTQGDFVRVLLDTLVEVRNRDAITKFM